MMQVAKTLDDTITGIDRTRARVLARTEIMNAHAEGSLNGMEDLLQRWEQMKR
jgi:hypothetical protein